MDTTQQVLRGTDVLRVQAANGPRGALSAAQTWPPRFSLLKLSPLCTMGQGCPLPRWLSAATGGPLPALCSPE